MPVLKIPERFNKNAPTVRAMGSPAETGTWLIRYMCQRIGLDDLRESDVLDFGCGCRFVEAIVNQGIGVKSYTGIDVDREMIDFMNANIADPRVSLIWWDTCNATYNPAGTRLAEHSELPVSERYFDIICMFSVITHQLPCDAEHIFRLLRRHIRPDGHLFFSATLAELPEGYRELQPEAPTGHSAYSLTLLQTLLDRSGWRITSIAGKRPPRPGGIVPIQDSFLCVPEGELRF